MNQNTGLQNSSLIGNPGGKKTHFENDKLQLGIQNL